MFLISIGLISSILLVCTMLLGAYNLNLFIEYEPWAKQPYFYKFISYMCISSVLAVVVIYCLSFVKYFILPKTIIIWILLIAIITGVLGHFLEINIKKDINSRPKLFRRKENNNGKRKCH